MNKFIVKAKNAIANKKAEMYVSKAVWVVGVLLVGGMLVWGIYSIMGGTVMPKLETTIKNYFTKAESVSGTGNGTDYTYTKS